MRKQAIGNYTLSHALGLKAKMQQAADEKQVVSSVELEANEAKVRSTYMVRGELNSDHVSDVLIC